jgi:UDP:flavonoid glycosyltransferase YjiC (YdhE family)
MAARGRIPLVQVGNGFTVPPAEMPRFPLLHRQAPPAFDEARTLETVNAAAVRLGVRRLDRLPQLFSGDARVVQTIRLLDPYDTQRVSPVDGPFFEEPPRPRAADARQVFAYLSTSDGTQWPCVYEALVPIAKRLRVHAPLWPKAQLDRLAAAGARVDTSPQPIVDVLVNSRLVVHLGGGALAAEALAAGVPQLILANHVEQNFYGEALEGAGVGRLVRTYLPETRLESDEIMSMIDDDTIAARADALGSHVRSFAARHNVLERCEAVCMDLLQPRNL